MNKFIESIQRVYPNLIIKDFYVNEIGQNNDVIVVNDSLVFRFPKYEQEIVQLRRETEILRYIENKVSLPIPVPVYEFLTS
ncbi:hypothetical protein [Bacillus sp. ISL-39]|uniref:hypothetical protein n=1 Tax=Bacillus sp. ISL-39 TaxID=2819124 RepID=UPI00203591E1|nr:hypothetical protein [Bacillus sp. ISL-39]